MTKRILRVSPSPLAISGSWVNNRGSILELVETDSNQLSGFFTTAVAHTKECIGYRAPVTGFINDNAIALSVDMSGCGSPVVFTLAGAYGINEKDQEQINTLGIVQYSGDDHWDSQIINSEYFLRTSNDSGTDTINSH